MKVTSVGPAGTLLTFEPLKDSELELLGLKSDDGVAPLTASDAKGDLTEEESGQGSPGLAQLIDLLEDKYQQRRKDRRSRRELRRPQDKATSMLVAYTALEDLEYELENRGRRLNVRG